MKQGHYQMRHSASQTAMLMFVTSQFSLVDCFTDTELVPVLVIISLELKISPPLSRMQISTPNKLPTLFNTQTSKRQIF